MRRRKSRHLFQDRSRKSSSRVGGTDADSLCAEHAALVESIEVEYRGTGFLGARAVRLESYQLALRRFSEGPKPSNLDLPIK